LQAQEEQVRAQPQQSSGCQSYTFGGWAGGRAGSRGPLPQCSRGSPFGRAWAGPRINACCW
jgi:hypothetical protein